MLPHFGAIMTAMVAWQMGRFLPALRPEIRDLMGNAAARYAAYTMDIIQGERAVASIPFAAAA
jgi:hypothetical protein